jgi:hypothetical protein
LWQAMHSFSPTLANEHFAFSDFVSTYYWSQFCVLQVLAIMQVLVTCTSCTGSFNKKMSL